MRSNCHAVIGLVAAIVFNAFLLAGCNSSGEDAVAEKDLAVSSTIKNAMGAAGSTLRLLRS